MAAVAELPLTACNMDGALHQEPTAPHAGAMLEVVGGGEKGGIIVREGKGTSSKELEQRLSMGSLIKALATSAGRVHYQLVVGSGPQEGWVSERVGGRDLLAQTEKATAAQNLVAVNAEAQKIQEEALSIYGKRLAEGREANSDNFPGFNRTAFPLWNTHTAHVVPEHLARAQLERDLGQGLAGSEANETSTTASDGGSAELEQQEEGECDADSDGEAFVLCKHCKLPVGEVAYGCDAYDRNCLMHGECKAQQLLKEMRDKEDARRQRGAELKKSRHEEFEIGWKADAVPRNAGPAEKLGCGFAPQGLCCLVLSGDRVEVAPTLEPAGAVNLEYLSIALQVRRSEGTEPLFSLDPVESAARPRDSPEGSMQMKRFEPEWLAGTSVGEIMFQADYHLKELSMGEYEQPVVGMKSCFDQSEESGPDEAWSGREWFVVRKAEMHISEDRVLVPYLKMGVEAREQVVGPDGLEDAPVTRPSHPLVRYAEAFTQRFDLIAERKGVVYQLREVAKASIMAKYLLESGLQMQQPWFSLADEPAEACCMEVPQLWNDRCFANIFVQDGEIVDDKKDKGIRSRVHGVYGGVDFGVDRFRLTAPSRVATSVVAGRAALGRPASSLMATTAAGLHMGPARQFTRLAGPLSAMSVTAPSRLSAPLSAMAVSAPLRAAGLAAPQGVDLNLDKFNLSATTAASGEVKSSDANLAIGKAFWSELNSSGSSNLSEEDQKLFREVFNPFLSDRRAEGDHFAPPPTSYSHIQTLKRLVKDEESVRGCRKAHFLSQSFDMENAGPLFPSSWTSSVQGQAGVLPGGGYLQARPEYKSQKDLLRDALSAATPVFDRVAEDGMQYRIYRFGSLEVRTMRPHGGAEDVGVVFSVSDSARGPSAGARAQPLRENDQIVKVTEYIERPRAAGDARRRASFVVLECDGARTVVTEELADGSVAWKENPAGLELRTSLAKVIRAADCRKAGATVGDMKKFQITQDGRDAPKATKSRCKRYAQFAYSKAVGEAARLSSGFHKKGSFAPAFVRAPRVRSSRVGVA